MSCDKLNCMLVVILIQNQTKAYKWSYTKFIPFIWTKYTKTISTVHLICFLSWKSFLCFVTFALLNWPCSTEVIPHNLLFQNDWCEVAFVQPDNDIGPSYVNFSLDDANGELCTDPTTPSEDWRVQTGLSKSGQTWAQQSGRAIFCDIKPVLDMYMLYPICLFINPVW